MVELIKEGFVDDGRQGSTNASGLHALLHNDGIASLLDAVANGLHVKGLQADQVDHLEARQFSRIYPEYPSSLSGRVTPLENSADR